MYNNGEVAKRRKTEQTVVVVGRWEQLPNGPLIEIARRLSNMEDFEVLHLVCRSWYSVLREFQCKFLDSRCTSTPHVPWLLMADHGGVKIGDGPSSSNLCLRPCSSKGKTMLLYFYRLSFQRIRELVIRFPPELPLDNNCRLYSAHGWLLVARKGSNLSLYNPFYSSTRNYIPLPGPSTLAKYVSRFTLSASPCTTESYTVMIMYEINEVALWRTGDESWTLLHPQPREGLVGGMNFLDVTFYRCYYYAFNQHGSILRFCAFEDVGHYGSNGAFVDSDNENFRWIHIGILSPPRIFTFHWKAYFLVVDSSSNEEEKLFVVIREGVKPKMEGYCIVNNCIVNNYNYFITTTGFRVVEIVVCPGESKVHTKEVISLGNRSLFVGRNQAFAIEIPQERVNPSDSESKNAAPLGYYGCKPNYIYFTDESDDRFHSPTAVDCGKGKDMGVFNMADCSIERRFDGLDGYIPMLWVEPRC